MFPGGEMFMSRFRNNQYVEQQGQNFFFSFFFESNYSVSKHEASYCTLLAKVYCKAPCGLTPGPWTCKCPNWPGRKVPWWSASFPPRVLDVPS